MPTDNVRSLSNSAIQLRRAVRGGYVEMQGNRPVARTGAPRWVHLLIDSLSSRPEEASSRVISAMLRNKIEQKYQAVGGFKSPLGLPVDPSMPLERFGEKTFVRFRGGLIETTFSGIAVAIEELVVKVIWTALECRVRQEGTDEVYGSIGGLGPSGGSVQVTHFPASGSYWSLGAPNNRVVLPNVEIYRGRPDDIVVAVTLIEHDSGNIDAAKQAIASKLLSAAQSLGSIGGIPAEALSSDQGWLSDLTLGLVDVIADVLGAEDDPYIPQTLRISWPEIAEENYSVKQGSRSGDPRTWPYTHSIVLSGTDEGGDTGHYAFYFKVEKEMHRREI